MVVAVHLSVDMGIAPAVDGAVAVSMLIYGMYASISAWSTTYFVRRRLGPSSIYLYLCNTFF